MLLQGLESLAEFATERFGSEAVIAIDTTMSPRARHTRMQRFCAQDRWALLQKLVFLFWFCEKLESDCYLNTY